MLLKRERYDNIPLDEWRWGPYFSSKEFRCRGTNQLILNTESMDKLWAIRKAADFPFIISSAGRTPEYNATVSSTGLDGPHTTGQAFDVVVYGVQAFWLISHAAEFGFTGIGVNQKGPYSKRFIHLDDLGANGKPRPWVWSY